ncbi:MAG: hypothetical protein AB8C84_09360 [Oligoflexales bacterium]
MNLLRTRFLALTLLCSFGTVATTSKAEASIAETMFAYVATTLAVGFTYGVYSQAKAEQKAPVEVLGLASRKVEQMSVHREYNNMSKSSKCFLAPAIWGYDLATDLYPTLKETRSQFE